MSQPKFRLGGDTGTSTPLSLSIAIPDYSAAPSSSDNDSEDNLPYPPDLDRSDFLSPNFDPQTYLSTLRSRHQTLEDLRTDLRQRSQLLNQELLDLVNNNYESFLSLGADLKGGEEKVEGVRVGLLGFEREVEGIKRGLEERLRVVGQLLEERRAVRRDVVMGRGLLEVGVGVEELEQSLGVKDEDDVGDELDIDFEDEEDEADDLTNNESALKVPVRKLRRHTNSYVLLSRQIQRLGPEHPFLQAQQPRMREIRQTLLLDLGTTLKQAKAAKDSDAMLAIVGFFAELGAEQEGVRALKGN